MKTLPLDYMRYKVCIVRITIKNKDGDLESGTGFHIGDGYIVTAKHVVENNELVEVVGHRSATKDIEVRKMFLHPDPRVDLAVLETNFSLAYYMEKVTIQLGKDKTLDKIDHIEIGGHLDDWLGEELVLSEVLLFGFPTIPMTAHQGMVAVRGEVNAVIDKYTCPHPSFVISPLPRGGFSGGPVLSEYGFLLGVFTESLILNNKPTELGFGCAISVEPLWNLLHDNGIYPGANGAFLRELYDSKPIEDVGDGGDKPFTDEPDIPF